MIMIITRDLEHTIQYYSILSDIHSACSEQADRGAYF